MKYFLEKDGKKIEATPERWIWGVVYKDGTEMRQFEEKDGEGVYHQIGEVKQDEIALAVLHRMDDMGKRIDIPWRVGMKLVHKYRNFVFDYMGGARKVKVYIFGFKEGKTGCFVFVLPDDRIVMSQDENADITLHGI